MSLAFERGEVLQALKLSNGKSQGASLMLIQSLGTDHGVTYSLPEGVEDDDIEEMRFDERTALEAIFGDDAFAEVWYEVGQVVGCEITFSDGSALLVRHDAPSIYPHQVACQKSLGEEPCVTQQRPTDTFQLPPPAACSHCQGRTYRRGHSHGGHAQAQRRGVRPLAAQPRIAAGV